MKHPTFCFDAAVTSKGTWCGVFCFSPQGSLLMVWSVFEQTTQPERGEAFAAKEAIQLAESMNTGHLLFQGDAKDINEEIQNNGYTQTASIEDIIKDIKPKLSPFDSCNVNYIPREQNFLAQNVAKWASGCNFVGSILIPSLPLSVLRRADGQEYNYFCIYPNLNEFPVALKKKKEGGYCRHGNIPKHMA